MSTDSSPKPKAASTAVLWTGRVLGALPVPLLLMSAGMKLSKSAAVIEGFEKFGYPSDVILPIGVVELVSVLLYAVPRTSILGALLLTAYLGGAVATHVRAGDPWFGPVLFGVFIWLGFVLRDPRLRELLPLTSPPTRPHNAA